MSTGGFIRDGLRISFAAALIAGLGNPLFAANFTVNNSADDGSTGTLRWAINRVNAAGPGNHSITLNDSVNSLTTTDDLPPIDGTGMNIVINGRGATLSGENQNRLFFVVGGNVTLKNFNLEN